MIKNAQPTGLQMWNWAKDLFPICRSITGPGVRDTLSYLSSLLPDLVIHAVPSGTKAFDWTVPDEWSINDAYVLNEAGDRIIDFRRSNLHVVGYSTPIDQWMSRQELDENLHSLPAQPDAIPYVASYYNRRWGFCLSHRQRSELPDGKYRVVVDSELKPGILNYGELILPGKSDHEVLLSTYICHPSLANNELSGPVVTAGLAQWLSEIERRYTYRIIFIPETIGAIVYLSRNLKHLKQRTAAGFVVTCVGDDRNYSYLPSRKGNTLADRAAVHALTQHAKTFTRYTFLDRGSDERQYCSPGVDLPVCSIMRSRYGSYPEYHTSLDNLGFITPTGLEGAFSVIGKAIGAIEMNRVLKANSLCEPQYSKYGLRGTLIGNEDLATEERIISNIVAYADGSMDLLDMADLMNVNIELLDSIAKGLEEKGLVSVCKL